MTGITPAVFDKLLADLLPRHGQADVKRKSRPDRRRQIGAGRKHALDLSDRLLMLLISYRASTTHVFLGFLFGVDDSAVGRDINPLQPLLTGIFRIPERRVKIEPDEMKELFFDATERPTRRPRRGQREYYSGEKQRHTLKTQVVAARGATPPSEGPQRQRQRVRIAAVYVTQPGGIHDKEVYDRSRVVPPPGVPGMGDTGYLGTSLEPPHRKPRGGRLTDQREAENGEISRPRIVVEHGIGEMKTWRVAAERYRNPVPRHTMIMKDVAGLRTQMYA